jgi:hypothetical protein
MSVQEFPMRTEMADTIRGERDVVEYYKNVENGKQRLVRRFRILSPTGHIHQKEAAT